MFYIAVILLIIIIISYIFCLLFPVKLKPKYILGLWYIFIISFAIFCYYAEPSKSDDLYRHYANIDRIRNGREYNTYLLGVRIIFLLVSKLPENGWLPCLTILSWGYFISEIIKDYLYHNKYKTKAVLIYFLVLLGGCNIFYLVSGIRCALVSSIWAYAYIIFYLKGKKREFYIWEVLGASIHYIGIVFIILHIIYTFFIENKKRNNWLKYMIFLLLGALVTNLLPFLSGSLAYFTSDNSSVFNQKVNMYLSYEGMVFFENFLKVLAMIIIFLCCIKIRNRKDAVIHIEIYFLLTILATSSMVIFVERIPYLVSIMALPIIDKTVNDLAASKRKLFYILSGSLYMLQFVYACHRMFSHIEFNGYNIKNIFGNLFSLF